ncbi:hypothetical protein JR316_0002514 [Psilocybe cubensis]|uniref:BTB domain-containing protein n=2 Tax=Psilocybe cubensis TaxID=181762 RepID=A0A8H7Y8E5_PSICU|nr:hypothetical protein JR316_0002514 [Psilocybe cubensis]KAH9485604.1 hypothetical protein JR316_0002514 [Psilocybe cubensis]
MLEVQTGPAMEIVQPCAPVILKPDGVGKPIDSPKPKKHKRFYMPEGDIIIQVENTLFRLKLAVLHEHSPVLRSTITPLQSGRALPIVGYNNKRPLILHQITEIDFVRLCSILFPSPDKPAKIFHTVDALLSVLRVATSFQMERVRNIATDQLDDLPIDPIRKIAIWEEFHLDPDLLLSAFATLCQRSEPLTLPMTMSLGIRNFTKVAASRDLYRQRVGCCGCRTSLSSQESQSIANEIVSAIFVKQPPRRLDKSLL